MRQELSQNVARREVPEYVEAGLQTRGPQRARLRVGVEIRLSGPAKAGYYVRSVVVPSVVAAWLATVIAGGAAQTGAPGPAVDRDQLLSDLRTLSADDMEGRRVDTPGSARARAFVVRRFKESGLVPFGASYEHPFTF